MEPENKSDSHSLKNSLRHHCIPLGILSFFVLALYHQLFFVMVDYSHESPWTMLRVIQYRQEISAGYLHPMLFNDAVKGAGHAFPVFYPPFGYLVAVGLDYIFNNAAFSTNMSFLLSVLCSAFAMYAAGNVLTKNRWIPVVAAIIYITGTYRFVDVFVRGVLAECWFFVWPPILLMGICQILAGKRAWLLIGLGMAGAILSHSVLSVWLLPFLALSSIPIFIHQKWKGFFHYTASGILGVCVAALYIIPQQFYLPQVWASKTQFMGATLAHMIENRVRFVELFELYPGRFYLDQYWDSVGSFGFSLPALFIILSLPLIAFLVVRKRKTDEKQDRGIFYILLGCWLFYFFVLVRPQILTFDFPLFSYLQFPYRLLSLLLFCHSVFFLFALRGLKQTKALTVFLCIVTAICYFSVPNIANNRYQHADYDLSIAEPENMKESRIAIIGFASIFDYAPLEINVWDVMANYETYELTAPLFTTNSGTITEYNNQTIGKITFEVESNDGGSVTIPILSYAFWFAELSDGTALETGSNGGYLSIDVPAGNHSILVERRYTWPYYLGWLVSIMSITGLFFLQFRKRKEVITSS